MKYDHPLAQQLFEAMQVDGQIDPQPILGLSLVDGFSVQRQIFESLGKPVVGSKLLLKDMGCLSAPLLFVSESSEQAFKPRVGIEVELAFVLGKSIERGATRADVVDAIADVRLGIELVGSRYQGGARGDFAVNIADMMANIGYVLGPKLDRRLLNEGNDIGTVKVRIGDETTVEKPAAHADRDPLKSIVALANQSPFTPLAKLDAGQVITTGALCGLIPIPTAGKIEVTLAERTFVLTLAD